MKVLVISSYDEIWNAVRPEGELFIGMHHRGVDVTIMTEGHAPYADRFREEGLKVIDFHPRHKFKIVKAKSLAHHSFLHFQYDFE